MVTYFAERPLPELGPIEIRPNRPALPNMLRLTLSGKIGPDEPINLADIRRQIACQTYNCIEIEITSTGGSAKESIAIFHFLRSLPVPIKATAKRYCLSGGLLIYMAASLRVMEIGTDLLIHPTNCERSELPEVVTAAILRARADALAEVDAAVVAIFAARTGFTAAFFETEKATEDTLNDHDAIASGIVHEICGGMTEKCEPGLPDRIARFAADPAVYVPPHLLTPNFRAACDTARFFASS